MKNVITICKFLFFVLLFIVINTNTFGMHTRNGFTNSDEGNTRKYNFNDIADNAGFVTKFSIEEVAKKIPAEILNNWTLEYYIYTSFEDAELAMVEYLEMSSLAMLNNIDYPLAKGKIGDNCWHQLPLGSIRFIRNNVLISIWPKIGSSIADFTSVENIAREIDQIIIALPKIKDAQLIPAPKVNSIELVSDLPKKWEDIVKIKVNASDLKSKKIFFRKYADGFGVISETGNLTFGCRKNTDSSDLINKAKVKIWVWNEDYFATSTEQYITF